MAAGSEQRRIKGSVLIYIIKAIRGTKDKPWDRYLTKEAKDLISQKILPSNWYAYDPFLISLNAVYEIIGNRNPEFAAKWGRINGRNMFETVYKNLAEPGETESTLTKLEVIARKTFSKGLAFKFEKAGDRHYRIKYFENDRRVEPIVYFFKGWIEALIEMTGGKDWKVDVIQKHWEGGEATVFDVIWN